MVNAYTKKEDKIIYDIKARLPIIDKYLIGLNGSEFKSNYKNNFNIGKDVETQSCNLGTILYSNDPNIDVVQTSTYDMYSTVDCIFHIKDEYYLKDIRFEIKTIGKNCNYAIIKNKHDSNIFDITLIFKETHNGNYKFIGCVCLDDAINMGMMNRAILVPPNTTYKNIILKPYNYPIYLVDIKDCYGADFTNHYCDKLMSYYKNNIEIL